MTSSTSTANHLAVSQRWLRDREVTWRGRGQPRASQLSINNRLPVHTGTVMVITEWSLQVITGDNTVTCTQRTLKLSTRMAGLGMTCCAIMWRLYVQVITSASLISTMMRCPSCKKQFSGSFTGMPTTVKAIALFWALNFLSHSISLAQNTLMMMSHSLIIHLPPAHQSHPPSHIHCFIPGSKLAFFTNLFHHSLLASTWTACGLLNDFSF